MSRINVRNNIEIERNIIERALMSVRTFVKNHRKPILYSWLVFFLSLVFIITGLYFQEKKSTSDMSRFELIMERYSRVDAGNTGELKAILKDLNTLREESYFGFAKKMAGFAAGNIHFELGNFEEAGKLLSDFSNSSPSELLAVLAVKKTAVISEQKGDYNTALKLYKMIESDYPESEIMDQVLFNIGRVYVLNGDKKNAEEYFNKVISLYPSSPLSERSRNRIFYLAKE